MSLFMAYRGEAIEVDQELNHILAQLFPEVDRPSEYRSADAWVWANPRRRPKNMKRFLVNWFKRRKRFEIAIEDNRLKRDELLRRELEVGRGPSGRENVT